GVKAEKTRALFAFGDSYADTGNHDAYNTSENGGWRRPYGFHWPGYPTGRYASGKIQTDYWAEILGLPTPIPYQMLKTHECEEIPNKIVHGVNFAFGGSGLFEALGYITIPNQVKQFKKLMKKTGVFGAHDLARSIVLLSNAGQDYYSYLENNNSNVSGLVSFVPTVVNGTVKVVKELYDYGFRNFVVSDLVHMGCVPEVGRTSCDSIYQESMELHSKLLSESVQQLIFDLKGFNIIIPDLPSAYAYIFANAANYGFDRWFEPCCATKGEVTGCAEVDEKGGTLFEVCEDTDKRFFWDYRHPTHRGWHALMSLYVYGSANKWKESSFVKGASNLIEWVKSIGFDAHNISS
ncbi:hypothetical protein KI387_026077, partial [Taxus chinensis]